MTAVASGPDGVLASGGSDRAIRLWDTRTGKTRQVLRGHGAEVASLRFAPGGDLLLSAGYDHTARLWSLGTGEEIASVHVDSIMHRKPGA